MYDLGDQVPISVTVRDASGVLVNPAAATLGITKPDGSTITPGVPLPPVTVGKPQYNYLSDTVGRHVWRMVTATPAGSQSGVFYVRTSDPRWIISLDEARAQLNVTGSTGDAELEEYLQVTTDIVENIIGPVSNLDVVEEIHPAGRSILLNKLPVVSITSITPVDLNTGIVYSAVDYVLNKKAGIITRPYGAYFGSPVTVAYVAGRSNQTPEAAIMAAKIIIQHLYRSQQLRPSGPPVPGLNTNEPMVPMLGFGVPNAAVQMLMPHSRRRVWLAG